MNSDNPGKVLFLSDFHLGIPDHRSSREREDRIISFLREQTTGLKELYILGDVFDFWFEYKTVVPKGYIRLQAFIAGLTDSGIPVHLFTGNHDQWQKTYFEEELGVKVYHDPVEREISGKRFFIGHGDGLGPGDHGYKFIRKVFRSPVSRWLFRWLHPDIGVGIAGYFSRRSRLATGQYDSNFLGEENEWLVQFAKDRIKSGSHVDYFVFGHRHLPLDIRISDKSRYINLGDWIRYDSYAVFDGSELHLERRRE